MPHYCGRAGGRRVSRRSGSRKPKPQPYYFFTERKYDLGTYFLSEKREPTKVSINDLQSAYDIFEETRNWRPQRLRIYQTAQMADIQINDEVNLVRELSFNRNDLAVLRRAVVNRELLDDLADSVWGGNFISNPERFCREYAEFKKLSMLRKKLMKSFAKDLLALRREVNGEFYDSIEWNCHSANEVFLEGYMLAQITRDRIPSEFSEYSPEELKRIMLATTFNYKE